MQNGQQPHHAIRPAGCSVLTYLAVSKRRVVYVCALIHLRPNLVGHMHLPMWGSPPVAPLTMERRGSLWLEHARTWHATKCRPSCQSRLRDFFTLAGRIRGVYYLFIYFGGDEFFFMCQHYQYQCRFWLPFLKARCRHVHMHSSTGAGGGQTKKTFPSQKGPHPQR